MFNIGEDICDDANESDNYDFECDNGENLKNQEMLDFKIKLIIMI